MSGSDWFAQRLGLYLSDGRLAPEWCSEVTRCAAGWESAPSTVYRESRAVTEVLPSSRRSTRVWMPDAHAAELGVFLDAELPRLGVHFDQELRSYEEPQLLWYREGDFFERHRDGRREADGSLPASRRVSIVIALSARGRYEGGEFVVYPDLEVGTGAGFNLELEPGRVLAFEGDLSHEVRPVTSGDRFSIVSWAR